MFEIYKDKNVFIFGGGDSALDWTVELAKVAKSVSLVHRRDEFRGAQHTEAQMRDLVKDGSVNLLTPYQIESINGDNIVTGVTLKNFDTKESVSKEADELLEYQVRDYHDNYLDTKYYPKFKYFTPNKTRSTN